MVVFKIVSFPILARIQRIAHVQNTVGQQRHEGRENQERKEGHLRETTKTVAIGGRARASEQETIILNTCTNIKTLKVNNEVHTEISTHTRVDTSQRNIRHKDV